MNRWFIILTGIAINSCLGALYSWSIFVVPLSKEFGWSRAQLSWPFTVSLFTFALVMVAAGKWQDNVGPRIVCVTGGIVTGIGIILTSFITSFPALVLTYGVIGGAGMAMSYVTPVVTSMKWFPDKKGLAAALTVSGFVASVFRPIPLKLIMDVGIMNAFFYLGIIYIVVIGGLGMILHNPPPGYKPKGWEPPAPAEGAPTVGADWKVGNTIKTPTFWLLWLALLGNASMGVMVISLIAPYAKTLGISAVTAAFIIGYLSIANGLGRIIAGWLSDLIGPTRVMVVLFSITTVTAFLLPVMAKTTIGYAIGLLVLGASYGSNYALFPAAIAEFFGSKNLGANYGALFTAWGVAGVVGPQSKAALLRKFSRGLSGEELRLARLKAYKISFYIGAAFAALALVSALLARPPGEDKDFYERVDKTGVEEPAKPKRRWFSVRALNIALITLLVLVGYFALTPTGRWWRLSGKAYRLMQQGKYEKGVPVAEEALRIGEEVFGPDDYKMAISLNNLGEFYRYRGRYAEAEPLHKRALAIREKVKGEEHPKVAQSLNNLAMTYLEQGRYAEAVPLQERAVAILEKALGRNHPLVAKSLKNYAALLRKTNRAAEAAKMEARAKRIRTGQEVKEKVKRGMAYLNQQRWDDAIASFREAIHLKPDSARAYFGLGTAYHKKGQWDAAIGSFKKGIHLKPDSAGAHRGLGTVYFKKGQWDDAIASYKETIRLKPDVALSHAALGGAYGKKDQHDLAIASYKEAVRLEPGYVLAHFGLGVTYVYKGDRKAALVEYEWLKTRRPRAADMVLKGIRKIPAK
ncbi:MAG: MFS transporter [bacterium]|nr:MFS transporter [bacterium]